MSELDEEMNRLKTALDENTAAVVAGADDNNNNALENVASTERQRGPRLT